MSPAYPISGEDSVIAAVDNLAANMQKNAIRAGLTAAAAEIRNEARLLVRKDSGKLAKAIVSGRPDRNQDGTYSVWVYVDEKKEHGFLGYFHEYGVTPHFIAASGSKLKGSESKAPKALTVGTDRIFANVHHPGVAARPFLRPAADAKADDAVNAFNERIKRWAETFAVKTGYDAFADAA